MLVQDDMRPTKMKWMKGYYELNKPEIYLDWKIQKFHFILTTFYFSFQHLPLHLLRFWNTRLRKNLERSRILLKYFFFQVPENVRAMYSIFFLFSSAKQWIPSQFEKSLLKTLRFFRVVVQDCMRSAEQKRKLKFIPIVHLLNRFKSKFTWKRISASTRLCVSGRTAGWGRAGTPTRLRTRAKITGTSCLRSVNQF